MAQTKVKRELIDGSLGTDWQSAPKTTNFVAVAGEGYFVDTTSNTVTVTLPTSPSSGDEIIFQDYAGTFTTNKIILTSSDKIQGSTNDFLNSTNNATINLVYQNTAKGWTADNLTTIIPAFDVDYLVVAGGGGGGGYYRGGGGGAGGLRTSYGAASVNAISCQPGTNYAVEVGPGGAGGSNAPGSNGTNSVFASITSTGGGKGTSYTSSGNTGVDGGDGGSGGGSGGSDGTAGLAGSGNAGNYTPSEGNNGGRGHYPSDPDCGGGGGGAGSAGNDGGSGSTDGDGGDGVTSSILNVSNIGTSSGQVNIGEVISGAVWFAGGGGGASYETGNHAIPGKGGGGIPSNPGNSSPNSYPGNGADGSPNSGGGGGGGSGESNPSSGVGGAGASGVVILRYTSQVSISNPNGGLTFTTYTETTTSANDTSVTVFTGGSGNIQFS